MLTKNTDKKTQIQMVSIDQLVPEDHLLRKIDKYVDFSFIYDLVEEKYSPDFGRPGIDPVSLIKIPLIQCMFGIKSMRQTIKEIEVNVAYRWFIGLDFFDEVPHFSTFGKNYKRRFEGTDLFEQIFVQILLQCMKHNLVDTKTFFVDATHVKAAANGKKAKKILVAKKTAKFFEEQLKAEIDNDREEHQKKPFSDDDDDDNGNGGSGEDQGKTKEKKVSEIDPESGWFHKGEHKEVFAYSVEAASDKNGWIMGYTVHPGNEHDSQTFQFIYEKLKKFKPKMIVADAGYKTPAIAKMLIDDGVIPVLPYKRPMTKNEFFKKREYVYDEERDCYICPNGKVLKYSTTNRDGYRAYKSSCKECMLCPVIDKCTKSKNHQKVIMRHIWDNYLDECERIRLTPGFKEIYDRRKQTIERIFGTAKENHGMRYTQLLGNEKMRMKVGLTFACLNMKKLVKILDLREKSLGNTSTFSLKMTQNLAFC